MAKKSKPKKIVMLHREGDEPTQWTGLAEVIKWADSNKYPYVMQDKKLVVTRPARQELIPNTDTKVDVGEEILIYTEHVKRPAK